ncbi:MAG TPA: phosphate ABC transporter permease subunit PstC [Porticoccaceae bacterium]|nr:phosphate ABC transporter permease subunit PstC [Porticoccaceae bacterium]HCO59157.1 phosphate ABC transporter permease subunit PstC [Porticoccaceae bacterium]
MKTPSLLIFLVLAGVLFYYLGRQRSLVLAKGIGGTRHLNSLPFYYGVQSALWCALPALLLMVLWLAFDEPIISALVAAGLPENYQGISSAEHDLLMSQIENIAAGVLSPQSSEPALVLASEHLNRLKSITQNILTAVTLILTSLGGAWAWWSMTPQQRARNQVEWVFKAGLLLCASLAIFTTLGIALSVIFESLRFFQAVPITEFLFGLDWSPQTAIRADQVGGSGAFGMVPLFTGTLLISLIAMVVAVPAGLMSAIYLAEYAGPRLRGYAKPALEILAGIPTVVYGFFAALTVAPFVREVGTGVGLTVSSESALAAGLVMGIMIIPFISSLADDVINAVPQTLRDGSLALGATHSETVKKVIFPAALPGIVGGVLLAVSRAIGETMIVVMAAGMAARLTANPLDAVTTVTVQIATLLVGDQEFDSPKTLSAFALGLMLFLVTLLLNIVALNVVKKYREQYD